MNLGATLYVKNSLEAVDSYKKAFNLSLGFNVKHEDGSYLHAELLKDGQKIFAVSESSEEVIPEAMLKTQRPTMSYEIDFESEEEVKKAYCLLAEDGHVLRPLGPLPWSPCSADIVDKFGVCWYIFIPAG